MLRGVGPETLYVLGALPPGRYVAVAGARDASREGLELARELGRALARSGYVVVTGLAKGVDESATTGALETGGRAVGVVPFIYEGEGSLWRRARPFLGKAAVVSERLYPSPNVRRDFALRNRTTVGMSLALLVPEARHRAGGWGTLRAAEFALRFGRLVAVFEPRAADGAVRKAFRILTGMGASAVRDVEDALKLVC